MDRGTRRIIDLAHRSGPPGALLLGLMGCLAAAPDSGSDPSENPSTLHEANFDPEFFKRHEREIASEFRRQVA